MFTTTAPSSRIGGLVCLLASFITAHAQAQCDPQWLPGDGLRGLDGHVSAVTSWDPDGPGPRTPVLLVGGTFTIAGDKFASNIAAFDPQTGSWSAVGSGIDGRVDALATLPDGTIVAGGYFTAAGGVPASNIARWDVERSAWSPMGSGMNDNVKALAILHSGEIVAGGAFTMAGGTSANRIAKWDASTSTWSSFGTGLNQFVSALVVLSNGDLVAGGRFSTAGGGAAANIARWEFATSTWLPLGSGTGNSLISAIVALPGDDLIVGGIFSTAGGVSANRIARWTASTSTWSPLGVGLAGSAGQGGSVLCLTKLTDGSVIVGGNFAKAGGSAAENIARWDVSTLTWSPLGKGTGGVVRALSTVDGGVVAGGDFATAGGSRVQFIAKWETAPAAWVSLGSGTDDAIRALATLPTGEVIAGGSFTTAGSVSASSIARWNPATAEWSPLGSGMNATVWALAAMSNGDCVAGGQFTTAGDVPAMTVARWDAAASIWKPMGAGFNLAVLCLATSPDGDVIAGGAFSRTGEQTVNGIARWNPLTEKWYSFGSGLTIAPGNAGSVSGLAVLQNGDVVAGGAFVRAGGVLANNIARWNAATSTWSPLGAGIDGGVGRVLALPNGDLVATDGRGVLRWDVATSTWARLGAVFMGDPNPIYALLSLPNGDLLAAGQFESAGGVPAANIARWSDADSSWHPVGLGLLKASPSPPLYALTELPDGGFAAGGNFAQAGEVVSARFARYSFTNVPWVAEAPSPMTLIAGETLVHTSIPAAGYADVSSQWQREDNASTFVDVVNGPAGASVGGGIVSGASGSLPSPTDGTPATLTIANIQHSDAGNYRVTFWNTCGEATSVPVEVKVKAHIADINADGQVDDADFILFSAQYDLMLCSDPVMPDSCSADFNHDGFVDDADFTIFVPAYTQMLFR